MTTVSSVTNTVLTTLDIGSGIDSAKLARDLTDAVQLPQERAIQKKIESERITKDRIYWTFDSNLDKGIDYDYDL